MKKIKRNPEIVWRIEIEEEELLTRAGNGEDISEEAVITLVIADIVHQLNYVASKIWMLSDGTMGEDGIVTKILESFETDEKTLREDINFFLSRLLKEGWLIYSENKNT